MRPPANTSASTHLAPPPSTTSLPHWPTIPTRIFTTGQSGGCAHPGPTSSFPKSPPPGTPSNSFPSCKMVHRRRAHTGSPFPCSAAPRSNATTAWMFASPASPAKTPNSPKPTASPPPTSSSSMTTTTPTQKSASTPPHCTRSKPGSVISPTMCPAPSFGPPSGISPATPNSPPKTTSTL